MTQKDVQLEIHGPVAVVRLSRPAKRNALSDGVILALRGIFETLPDTVRAAVLDGEGDHFCAGLDLSELKERDAGQGLHHSRMWHAALERVQYGPVPVIAALHGAVVGGGLELASACHIRVADDSTFYALPEGSRGIFVGGGGAVRIPRLIGAARMTDMMLTGRTLDAAEAERYGVVNYLAPADGGLAKAMALARAIAGNAPLSNYATINALQRIHDSGYDEGLFFESMIATLTQLSPDAGERMRAFVERKAGRIAAPGTGGGDR